MCYDAAAERILITIVNNVPGHDSRKHTHTVNSGEMMKLTHLL